MKKRILALMLALFMVVTVLPTAALAAEDNANITVGLTLTGVLTMRITATADAPFDTVEVQIGDDAPITATQAGAEWHAPLMAHQMREDILVTLKNGDTAVGEPTAFTIGEYLNRVVAANPGNTALENLTTAVWDYGTCAANYANELGRITNAYDVPAAVLAANPDLSAYAYEFGANTHQVGASALLYLDEAVDLRVNFDAADVDAVEVDDAAAETTTADNKIVWEMKEILPQDFGKAYAVKALKDNAEVFAVALSPLSYANAMLAKDNATDDLKNLLKSMYLYNAAAVAYVNAPAEDAPIVLPYEEMLDKIQGGWIGQAVGVTWGYPTEFRYKYQIIPEADVPVWKSSDIHGCFWQDDLYVELPFMLAMNQNASGVNYDKNDIAAQFRDSTMRLWHANMYAQKNLRNGIPYPDSGSYLYNRCAEDLDWQISSDFVGMVYPGQVSLAAEKAFELGHLTNYGDGVYGGVLVAAMHASAFTAESIREICEDGVAAIPEGSLFRSVMDDVIANYDGGMTWEQNWQAIQNEWRSTGLCDREGGIAGSIDTKINSAYILIGLLYGEGDFENSMKISMRCGDDSDCNPSTVASVLGNYYGASAIPEKYKSGLDWNGQTFEATNLTFTDVINLNIELLDKAMAEAGNPKTNNTYTLYEEETIAPVTLEQWPDGVYGYFDVEVTGNTVAIKDFDTIAKNDELAGYVFDFGDGMTMADALMTTYSYAETGTYTIRLTTTGKSGEVSTVAKQVVISEITTPVPDMTIIGSLTKGGGGPGTTDINVINDGNTTAVFDTFMGQKPGATEYIGYLFKTDRMVYNVDYTQGNFYSDGGWFVPGTLKVQLLINGVWTDQEYASNYNGDQSAANTTYAFTLKTPAICRGVRFIGTAGGSAGFISVREIAVTQTKTLTGKNMAVIGAPINGGGAPGSTDITVIADGNTNAVFDSFTNGVAAGATGYIGYVFGEDRLIYNLDYTQGNFYSDGGWFEPEALKIQLLINGVWTNQEYVTSYNGNQSTANTTYSFALKTPDVCRGVRFIGIAGGSHSFISVREIAITEVKKLDNQAVGIIGSPMSGQGGPGSTDIRAIADGNTNTLFDSYRHTPVQNTYIGYVFGEDRIVSGADYTQGNFYSDGGWFDPATLKLQLYIDGVWQDQPYTSTYAGHDSAANTTYSFTLETPTVCRGLRFYGTAGGSKKFISVREITVQAESVDIAPFARAVSVNGATLTSAVDKWDLTGLESGVVSGSNALGTSFNPLFFNETASDFAVEAYFEYDPNGPAEQPDMFAGFEFKDGNAGCFVMAHNTGITYSGWVFENDLYDTAVLKSDTKVPVKFAVVKVGGTATIYVNDVLVKSCAWSTIAPWIPANNTMAIGLSMNTNNPVKMNASQYKLYAGTEAAARYNLERSTMTDSVMVNGRRVTTDMNKWNLTELGSGVVRGSYALGTTFNPLFFKQTASDFAVEAYFEYDPNGPAEQPDLFAGFEFKDGLGGCFVMANYTGYAYTDWNRSYGKVSTPVLHTGHGKRPVKFAIAKVGNTAYILMDDVLVDTVNWNSICRYIPATSTMAIGISMISDKPATMKASQYKLYAGTAAANDYIAAHTAPQE